MGANALGSKHAMLANLATTHPPQGLAGLVAVCRVHAAQITQLGTAAHCKRSLPHSPRHPPPLFLLQACPRRLPTPSSAWPAAML